MNQIRSRFQFQIIAVSGAVLGIALLLPMPRRGAIAGLPSLCPFQALTGAPCPGCGLTRSFVCLTHGDLGQALHWHLLGPVLFFATVATLLGALRGWRLSPRLQKCALALFVFAMTLHWGARLGGLWPLPSY